jgi:hypothetical protein
MALRKELSNFGQEYNDEGWHTSESKFIKGRQYFSASIHLPNFGVLIVCFSKFPLEIS